MIVSFRGKALGRFWRKGETHRIDARSGRHAVKVDKNWRITFTWLESERGAVDVDYEDYH